MPGRSIVARLAAPSRWWEWKIAVIALGVSLLHAAPAYNALADSKTLLFQQKGRHLLTHFGGNDPRGHAAKLDYRLVGPLLLRPFGGSVVVAIVLFALCGVVAYAVMARGLRAAGVAPDLVLVSLVALALTPIGGVFLLSVNFFDAIAILLAMLAGTARRQWLAGLLVFLALYTDERALIAVTLVFLAAVWLEASPRLRAPAFVVAVAAYVASRLALEATTQLRTEGGGIVRAMFENASRWPIALAFAFGAFWFVVIAGLRYAARRDRRGLVLAVAFAVAVVAAATVDDVTRSISYALPAAPVAIVACARQWGPARAMKRFSTVALVCALIPCVGMAGALGHWNPLPIVVLRWTHIL